MLIRSDTNRRGINWFDVWSTQSGGKLSGSNSADVLPHFLRQPDLSRLRYTKVGTALVTAPFWPSREVQKYSNIAQGYNGREPTPASIEFPNTQSVAVIALTLCLQLLNNNLQNSFITVTSNKNCQSTILVMLSFLKTAKSIGNVSLVSSWLTMKWLSCLIKSWMLLISLLTFGYNAPFTIVLSIQRLLLLSTEINVIRQLNRVGGWYSLSTSLYLMEKLLLNV